VPSDIDALADRAIEVRGLIGVSRARARAAEARAWAAEAQATVPMFMVGATYMQTPSMRPGLGVEVGITLPWFWSGEGPARDAARLEAEAELDEVARMERDVRVEVVGAARMIEVVARTLATLRERERPAAERALEAVAVTYSSGEVDLIAWLDAVRAVRELGVEEARLLGEGAHAQAELESAIGVSLAMLYEPTEERR
jgi:outer membrane protein TolC